MANSLWVQTVREGLAANKPTLPDLPESTFAFYYETDTSILKMWDGSAWVEAGSRGTAANAPKVAVAAVTAAGSLSTDAAALSEGFNKVAGADGTKGVILPVPTAGMIVYVKNNVNAILKVYPSSGGTINALSADGALSMAALTSAVYIAFDTAAYFTIPLLPS